MCTIRATAAVRLWTLSFGEDVFEMLTHCQLRDEDRAGDLLVRPTRRDKPQYLPFTVGER